MCYCYCNIFWVKLISHTEHHCASSTYSNNITCNTYAFGFIILSFTLSKHHHTSRCGSCLIKQKLLSYMSEKLKHCICLPSSMADESGSMVCNVHSKYSINSLIISYNYEWVSSVLRPHQHSIGYTGDGFYRSKDPTNSIKVLKEMLQKRKKTTKTTKFTYT